MAHLVSTKSPQEEEVESRCDRLAERMASVVHLIVRRVVERHIERLQLESGAREIHGSPISNSRKIHKMKNG